MSETPCCKCGKFLKTDKLNELEGKLWCWTCYIDEAEKDLPGLMAISPELYSKMQKNPETRAPMINCKKCRDTGLVNNPVGDDPSFVPCDCDRSAPIFKEFTEDEPVVPMKLISVSGKDLGELTMEEFYSMLICGYRTSPTIEDVEYNIKLTENHTLVASMGDCPLGLEMSRTQFLDYKTWTKKLHHVKAALEDFNNNKGS